FLMMPVVSSGVYYGNNIPLVFVGLMLSLLIARRHPLLSGILMSIAWLNPSIALPLVMLIVLFHVRDRRAVLAGLVLATIALGGLSLLVLGSGSFVEWVAGLSRYSRDIASQTEIAPLSGVYIDHVSSAVRTVLEAASLVAALALTGWWWVRNKGRQTSFGRTGWLWFAWFLATPYAHADDLILLAIPIMVMLGRDARHVLRFPGALAMYLLFIVAMGFPVRIGTECILLIAICCIIANRRWPETVSEIGTEVPKDEGLALVPA
ncbi:MAG: glycosyltransferase 87 family protein, partial [Chloroflexota bacterium]